ncbi:hypothetical protein GCM10008940_00700 [Microbulbifer agarilyticus]
MLIDASSVPLEMLNASLESIAEQGVSGITVSLFGVDEPDDSLLKRFPTLLLKGANKLTLDSILSIVDDYDDLDFLMIINAGDILKSFALKIYLKEFFSSREFGAIYSDSIVHSSDCFRVECRPSFCPDYLRECNYVSSSVIFNKKILDTDLLRNFGGPTSVGTVNHVLLLCLDYAGHEIQHLPYFLYEDRGSGLSEIDNVSQLSEKVVSYLGERMGYFVSRRPERNMLRVDWRLPEDSPLVSIIIPTRDQLVLLRQCVDSVMNSTRWKEFEIIIVNNSSEDPKTIEYLTSVISERVRVFDYDKPFNYSAINNFAAERANGDFLLLLNNDVEVISEDWLCAMLGHAARPDVACVGANLFYSNNTHQHAGVVIGYGGVAGHAHKFFERGHSGYMNRLITTQNYTAVTAACLLIDKKIFFEVGGLDEINLTVAFNDVDLCLKANAAGYRNVWVPNAQLYHHESVSRGTDKVGAAKKRFSNEIRYMKSRWNTDHTNDPAYNANLTLRKEDFSLRIYSVKESRVI